MIKTKNSGIKFDFSILRICFYIKFCCIGKVIFWQKVFEDLFREKVVIKVRNI